METIQDFLVATAEEIDAAQEKFPSNKHQLAALGEEVGELFNAMLEYDSGNPTVDVEHIVAEAIQVAAMAARVALEGDASFKHGKETS